MRVRVSRFLISAISLLIVASCGSSALPSSATTVDRGTNEPGTGTEQPGPVDDDQPDKPADVGEETTVAVTTPPAAAADPQGAEVTIDLNGPTAIFDRRVLGTNIPAWLGPERLRDPTFQLRALASGTTLVRMPGGSWSNAYDWSACETGDEERCSWPWAAKPSDFAEFMTQTGLPGMWTISINHTAQSAAAAVAFFNGELGDSTTIGVDREGIDWGDVDQWARLRSDGGHPEPIGIGLWEIGNEVYGGTKDSGGPGCKGWGWEHVWTCDGTEYVTGNTSQDGYLAIRAAMLGVDPTIEVGAVGVPKPDDWNNWGNEVIEAAGDEMDFYIVHQYGFESSPGTIAALRRPAVMWPRVVDGVRDALGNSTPIAITEYNLVAIQDKDTEASMTQALNGLYIAESIGQMASLGVNIANQWNLANGTASNGTNYGMIDADDYSPLPQYEALATWSRAGTLLLPVVSLADGVNAYPTLHDDGRVTLIVIGRQDTDQSWSITLVGLEDTAEVTTTVAAASEPTDTAFSLSTTTTELDGSVIELSVPAWSISSVEIVPSATG